MNIENLIRAADRETRKRLDAMPNVACMLVYPEERPDLDDIIRGHGGLEVVHTSQSPIDEGSFVYVQCDDEYEAEGLDRAWSSFRRFRRMLPPRAK